MKYLKLKGNNWNWIGRDMNRYTPTVWAPVPLLLWLYSGSFPNHHLGHCRKWTAPLTATLTKPHFSQLPYKLTFPQVASSSYASLFLAWGHLLMRSSFVHVWISSSLVISNFVKFVSCRGGFLISPKWKNFRSQKLHFAEKTRLNNAIWRSWHIQCKFYITSV